MKSPTSTSNFQEGFRGAMNGARHNKEKSGLTVGNLDNSPDSPKLTVDGGYSYDISQN